MKPLTVDELRVYLRAHGVPLSRIEQVISGFDLRQPVYERMFEPGEELFQYVRRPAAGDPLPQAGNWFCLRGALLSGLAIIGGGSGRVLGRYGVSLPFQAIEGTARPQAVDWSWSGGGAGGATQVYVPLQLIGRLHSLGPV